MAAKNETRPKIAMLMQSGEAGGVQRVMINLAHGLQAEGIYTSFLIGDARGEMMHEIPEDCEIIDFRKQKYRGDSKIFAAIWGIYSYMQKHPDTIILAAPGLAGTIVALIKVFCRHKRALAIVDNRCTLLKDGTIYHTLIYYCNKLLFRFLDGVIAAHTMAYNEQIKFYHVNSANVHKVYHPLVVPEKVQAAMPETEHRFIKDKADGAKILIAVGRLGPEKDFATLLKAFELVRKNSDSRLIVLGDGPLKEILEKLRQESQFSNDIDLYGYTNRVLNFMKISDLFILSSKEEAFGNVLIEAMSCGIPCVATDCASGGPRDIMNGGDPAYGALCPCENPQELADAILKTLDTPHDSAILRKRAELFSIAYSSREYGKIIKNLK